jgi:hypothetical protein
MNSLFQKPSCQPFTVVRITFGALLLLSLMRLQTERQWSNYWPF